MRLIILAILIFFIALPSTAQIGEFVGDEKNFYAATKQVNQFLKRFNGEENLRGVRFSPQDTNYRNPELRRKYLTILFDNKQENISPELKTSFMKEVIDPVNPEFLDLHGGQWFAQVSTTFKYQGKDEKLQLFLRLQEEKIGSKWVIFKAYFDVLSGNFAVDTADKSKFIHPMSHELDFMNLKKIFEDKDMAPVYTNREYSPDYLTLMLYEIKKGNLEFSNVNKVRFHFFQLNNWYFELTEFNRSGANTGWLISDLVKVDEQQKEQLRKFIYHESK